MVENICEELLRFRNILLLGFGKEGRSTYNFIRRNFPDRVLTIADQSKDIQDDKSLKHDRFVRFRLGEDYLKDISEYDAIIKSPGVCLKNHPHIVQHQHITSQTDLFLKYFHQQTIGITGTKGKSTVSSLIYHILKKVHDQVLLVGNIGTPVFDILETITPKTIIVYELSCHQLEFISKSPHISILLNIYEEHLDYYPTYQAYQQSKLNIIRFQNDHDTIIFNEDNPIIHSFLSDFPAPRQKISFSSTRLSPGSFHIDHNQIYVDDQNSSRLFYDGTERKILVGDHNLSNMAAASAACKLLSVPEQIIIESFADFTPLPHRLEYIGSFQNIDFYNDSISTIAESTIEALKALKRVDTLILGGYDRGIQYDHLVDFICHYPLQNLILVGQAGQRIYEQLKEKSSKHLQCYLFDDYQEIVTIAFQITRPKMICLLSPAAASYDLFKNFEARGQRFKELVWQIGSRKKYDDYQKQYPMFVYDSYTYEIKENHLCIEYLFNLADQYHFRPKIKILSRPFYRFEDLSKTQYDNLVFHIGLIEMISYWKSTCSPKIYIKPHFLSPEQIRWWKKLCFHGLGEFFYRNFLSHLQLDTFVDVETTSDNPLQAQAYELDDAVIIPIGGGKDSIVTLELIKGGYTGVKRPMVLNPLPSQIQVLEVAGYSRDDTIELERTLDRQLILMKEQGFFYGHTPFSSLLAFITLLVGAVTKSQYIALSNESSANEPTVRSSTINHQYSKTYEFEHDFRSYVSEYISSKLNYFSFLRPLMELQIGQIFSAYEKYFTVFRSCNVGSKEDQWCNRCSKCLFTFIILSPFLPPEQLESIFGENLMKKRTLESVYYQLIGATDHKPFECVGTIEEVHEALSLSLRHYSNEKPYLLNIFQQENADQPDRKVLHKQWDEKHFLPDHFRELLLAHVSPRH